MLTEAIDYMTNLSHSLKSMENHYQLCRSYVAFNLVSLFLNSKAAYAIGNTWNYYTGVYQMVNYCFMCYILVV